MKGVFRGLWFRKFPYVKERKNKRMALGLPGAGGGKRTHHLLDPGQNPGLLSDSGATIVNPIRARDDDGIHDDDTGPVPAGRQGAPQGVKNLLGVLGDGLVLARGRFLEAGHGRRGAGDEKGGGERGERRGGGCEGGRGRGRGGGGE